MRFDAVELKGHRTRIVRIEEDEIDHRRRRRHHDVALPIGDLAVGKIEQKVEAALGRAGQGKPSRQPADQNSAFDAAAQLEKTPAGKPRHVFLRQSRERSDDAQGSLDALGDGAFVRPRCQRHADDGGKIVDGAPGVRRETIADHGGGRSRRTGQRR
jgi:hypothetical protein